MKSKISGLVLLLLATTVSAADATAPAIIPAPVKAETRGANYRPIAALHDLGRIQDPGSID